MKLELLLILYAVKNKIEAKAKKRWYYQYLPVSLAEGFTLAEVLITLLVIGIVASMVIPAIINDTQDAEFKTAYKKALAVASQVIKQCYSEYLFESSASVNDSIVFSNNFDVFMSKFSVQKKCINSNNKQCWDSTGETSNGAPDFNAHSFIDTSGMAWSLRCPPYSSGWTSNYILVDTNGFKPPNKYGRDRWAWWILDKNNQDHGIPMKISIPGDVSEDSSESTKSFLCPTPPCYYKSWLTQ